MTTPARGRGLGRGLSAMIDEPAETPPADTVPAESGGLRRVPVDLLNPNPHQPRSRFPETELDELADSIRSSGVLQPILVRPNPMQSGSFEIIAGERRFRAAQRAGLHEVPVQVRDLDDHAVMRAALVENVQRSDLNPVDEARGYRRLVEVTGETQERVAHMVGKSRVHVTNTVRLLQLPDMVLKLLESGELTAGHARPLIGHSEAGALARRIVSGRLSVREAELLAQPRGRDAGATTRRSTTAKDTDTLELEGRLSAAVGHPVRIRDHGGKGEIRIRYQTYKELDRLAGHLTGVTLE